MTYKHLLSALTALCVGMVVPPSASAQSLGSPASDVVEVSFLQGWRKADGTHMAALKFTLAPGWKTYWRTPGDGGVPTHMDWSGSSNLKAAQILWPLPKVFHINGIRSIGYQDEFIVPLAFEAKTVAPIAVMGYLDFGVCRDICIPVHLQLNQALHSETTSDVAAISAALRSNPTPADQAYVKDVECSIRYDAGTAQIDLTIDMPQLEGANEALVIEPSEPAVWVSEPTLRRDGNLLHAHARLATPDGKPFTVNISQLRLTVLTAQAAVDIMGCR